MNDRFLLVVHASITEKTRFVEGAGRSSSPV